MDNVWRYIQVGASNHFIGKLQDFYNLVWVCPPSQNIASIGHRRQVGTRPSRGLLRETIIESVDEVLSLTLSWSSWYNHTSHKTSGRGGTNIMTRSSLITLAPDIGECIKVCIHSISSSTISMIHMTKDQRPVGAGLTSWLIRLIILAPYIGEYIKMCIHSNSSSTMNMIHITINK